MVCSLHGDHKKKLESDDRAAVVQEEGLDAFTISLKTANAFFLGSGTGFWEFNYAGEAREIFSNSVIEITKSPQKAG